LARALNRLRSESVATAVIGMIVCGGAGSRLGPLGAVIQKALLPIQGRPAVFGCVETLERLGCDEVWLLAGHLSHQIKEYFEIEQTRAQVTVLDTSTLSTTDAVRGVLDETKVDSFWYSHADIGLGDGARRALIEAQSHHPDGGTALLAVTRADKAPSHPHAALAGNQIASLGPASAHHAWCCIGIGRFDESMLVPEAKSGAFEYSLSPDAYRRIVPVEIGSDWTHLETLALYRDVK
jgi:choline kinase